MSRTYCLKIMIKRDKLIVFLTQGYLMEREFFTIVKGHL